MKKIAIAFGTFDGLHIGHKAVIDNVLLKGYTPLALSFSLPPKFKDPSGNLIMTAKTKEKELEKLGVTPIFMNFEEVKDILPKEFLEKVYNRLRPSLISFGHDFRFGKNAQGDSGLIKAFAKEKGIEYTECSPVTALSQTVSSSAIRQYISSGDIKSANIMLGRPFFFEGTVIKGDQRGRTIGFPTINQEYPTELVKPKYGVYLTEAVVSDKKYKAVTNVGIRPTFKTEKVMAETFIFDFSGSLYGETVKISFLDFLREEKKFSSLEELKTAITADKNKALNQFSFDTKGEI